MSATDDTGNNSPHDNMGGSPDDPISITGDQTTPRGEAGFQVAVPSNPDAWLWTDSPATVED